MTSWVIPVTLDMHRETPTVLSSVAVLQQRTRGRRGPPACLAFSVPQLPVDTCGAGRSLKMEEPNSTLPDRKPGLLRSQSTQA